MMKIRIFIAVLKFFSTAFFGGKMSKLYDEYLKLKEKDKNKLYLFRCGNFYIFIGNDCDYINEYIVLKKVKFTNEIYKCGFPVNSIDNYMRVFKNHNLDIEIVEKLKNNEKNVIEILKTIDVNNITPIEALIKLKELKESV